ncbi:MAG: hypothetical protein NUV74_05460 [Candidatus Brocadiaceae bacterium]|nr:hypothetical protein [Candidatus Brocadiaceae bacterium]
MTLFWTEMDWNKRIADLRQTAKENPKPKDKSDWVVEVMKQSTKEGRRAILDQVPQEMKGHVAARVKFLFEKKRKP